ncbi:alpha-1A adrenergic receptor-like [Elysia marginata]|uniref:Alpha-1A adrenergic receptor-like n=1 Tax=Elysia marginata TaxID=1093978 RepID=A0AAV4ESB2_9GAST|nr:alpha-1A adrenergic receptor-like [Elysia marginata]
MATKKEIEKMFLLELLELYKTMPVLWKIKLEDYHNRVQVKIKDVGTGLDGSVASSMLNTSVIPNGLFTTRNGSENTSAFPNLQLDKGSTKEGCMSDEFYVSPTIENLAFFTGVFLICENLLLVCVIGRTRALHTNTNILVASLAFTDIMIGTQCFMMGLTGYVGELKSWLRRRPFQLRIFHSFITSANYSLVIISMTHLAVLSVDRYLFVLWPFRYPFRITERRVFITAVGIWILGLSYMSLKIVVYLNPKYHANCLVVDAPFAYADGPLLCVYFMCLVVLIASISGLSRLALAHTRKREMLEGKKVKSSCDRRKGEIQPSQDVVVNAITSGVQESLTLQTISCTLYNAAKDTNQGDQLCCDKHTLSVVVNDKNKITNNNSSTPESALSSLHIPCTVQPREGQNITENTAAAVNEPTTITSFSSTINSNDKWHKRKTRHGGIVGTAIGNVSSASDANVHETNPKEVLHSEVKENFQRHTKVQMNKKLLRRTKFKILKFILVILGCYLICSFPMVLRITIKAIVGTDYFSGIVEHVTGLMLLANSGMNFFIMVRLNRDFRAALSQTFSFVKCSCRK